MSDVVSRLLAKLDEVEAKAREATPGPWRHNPRKHWRRPGTVEFEEAVFCGPPGPEALCVAGTGRTDDSQSMADADHIAEHDPAAVLRLCQAHRDIVHQREHANERAMNGPENERMLWSAQAVALTEVLFKLAAGYGIQEEE